MIQALPPAPPPIACVAPENAVGSFYIVLSGEPAQLQAVLVETIARWEVEAQAVDNGVGFAQLKGELNVPYKEVGGLIFMAQRRRISVSFYTDPPICGLEDEL